MDFNAEMQSISNILAFAQDRLMMLENKCNGKEVTLIEFNDELRVVHRLLVGKKLSFRSFSDSGLNISVEFLDNYGDLQVYYYLPLDLIRSIGDETINL